MHFIFIRQMSSHSGVGPSVRLNDTCAARAGTVVRPVVVVVVLPRLLCTVIGRKPANPPQEGDDIRRFHLDEFPVGRNGFPKVSRRS